jgi:hypothetical protein
MIPEREPFVKVATNFLNMLKKDYRIVRSRSKKPHAANAQCIVTRRRCRAEQEK